MPLENLMAEIEKCDILCANCHRIKTAKQLGWYKDLIDQVRFLIQLPVCKSRL